MFGLLIPYHVSLIFASKPFILKSDETHRLFDVFELVTHPWRMLVLFLLSGVATATPWPARAWSECPWVITARSTGRTGSM